MSAKTNVAIPPALFPDGRRCQYAGNSTTPGGMMYTGSGGVEYEMFVGEVFNTGPHFALVKVTKNKALAAVKVVPPEGMALTSGDVVIIGPLKFGGGDLPTAKYVFPADTKPINGHRATGLVVKVGENKLWAFAINEKSGVKAHVVADDIDRPFNLREGVRVSYVEEVNDRGVSAREVRRLIS